MIKIKQYLEKRKIIKLNKNSDILERKLNPNNYQELKDLSLYKKGGYIAYSIIGQSIVKFIVNTNATITQTLNNSFSANSLTVISIKDMHNNSRPSNYVIRGYKIRFKVGDSIDLNNPKIVEMVLKLNLVFFKIHLYHKVETALNEYYERITKQQRAKKSHSRSEVNLRNYRSYWNRVKFKR